MKQPPSAIKLHDDTERPSVDTATQSILRHRVDCTAVSLALGHDNVILSTNYKTVMAMCYLEVVVRVVTKF
jgi:hypothetical protein